MIFSEWKKLKESYISDIKSFKPHESSILELWEMIYEIEYKYNRLKINEFTGSPERKNNILSILETKANDIIDILKNTFLQSYDDYLNRFIMETPSVLDIIERPWQFIFEFLYKSLLKDNDEEVMKKSIKNTIKRITYKEPNFSIKPLRTYLRRDFYKDIEGHEEEFRKEENFGFVYGAFQIRDMGKKLIKINDFPLNKKFMILNEAINLTHNVGYFMFHYNELFGINKSDLDKLSNKDVSEWDKELKEIGVKF